MARLIDADLLKDALRTNEGAKALGHSVHSLFCVDEIIDKQPTVDATPRWIPVEERLPELHTKVLCCGVKGGRFIAELDTWGYEKHLCWDKKNGRGCPEVTHWMSLPEPPKEGK